MMCWKWLLIVAVVGGGCATRSGPPLAAARREFPADALITQRAILTARGRQFTLNGYLSLSRTGGKRLLVTENFGNVLADVLVKPDRSVHVMRSSAALHPEWIKRFVVPDLECIFGNDSESRCHVESPGPDHFIVKRFWYTLDLRIVEIKPGAQPPEMFEEGKAGP